MFTVIGTHLWTQMVNKAPIHLVAGNFKSVRTEHEKLLTNLFLFVVIV